MKISYEFDGLSSKMYNVKMNVAAELYKLGYITNEEAVTLHSERLDEVLIRAHINYPECISVTFQFENGLYRYIAVYNRKDNKVESVNLYYAEDENDSTP